MDKDKKNRSGSMSNEGSQDGRRANVKQQEQPGAPAKGNRGTGGPEKDRSNASSEKGSDRKGRNAV